MTKTSSLTKASIVKKGGGPTSQTRILVAIAQKNRMGVDAPCRKMIASLAQMTNGGSFSTICGRLKKKGFIELPDSKTITLTELGRKEAEPYLPAAPKSNKDFHDQLKEKISRAKVKDMFDLLADGGDHSLAELAELVGYDETNKSFGTYVGCLNPNVERFKSADGNKMIRLKEACFPFGRGAE